MTSFLPDVRMPEMDGLELLGRSQSHLPQDSRHHRQRGWGTTRSREAALRKGGEAFLQKPLRREDLLRILGRQAQGTV